MHGLIRSATRAINHFGRVFFFITQIIYSTFTKPFYFIRLVEQILTIGAGSLSITIVIGIASGLVMTINFGHGLTKFGGIPYVPAMVGLSIAREIAPLLTSLLVAGRVGSSIAAEIGAMNVTGQIDAIRAMATSPVRVLVVPRVLACIFSLPLLSSLACVLGILAGLFTCQVEFGMSSGFYLNKVFASVELGDFLVGIVKASFFGGIISVISCYRGLRTESGTMGVGKSTTWAVVTSSILILVSDFAISKLFVLIIDS